ncbi:MAG: DUF1648 domain-containing protein [Saprospiraceae bacterium]|nr:DUF1648 domain-containing protein [Saprospiraceae bacterium]
MKLRIKKELSSILIVAIPFIYLAFIWKDLPDSVPVHWNLKGEIDRYGSKNELWILPIVLPLLTYLIFLLVPFIDPKKQIESMGSKYHQLKLFLVLFMSLLCVYLIYATSIESMVGTKLLFLGIGALISIVGIYMPYIKPNYFIGVRTPWTLENNEVWKATHKLTGHIWVITGVLLALIAFGIDQQHFFWVFMGLILVIAFIPILYSYLKFKELDEGL